MPIRSRTQSLLKIEVYAEFLAYARKIRSAYNEGGWFHVFVFFESSDQGDE
ncbi:MAG: hypothetical protein AOA65_1137 [Candidatus Bathyarchaeota archaeon BA1]|nr:MAG: hypothetical protein AOA65_1137 [Candidatus Bathyarchaeota archaeon BA1]